MIGETMAAERLAGAIAEARAAGAGSLRELAEALTAGGVPTARGGSVWTATAVRRVLQRVDAGGVAAANE